MMIIAKFIACGDCKDKGNPFHWEEIILNLPGSWNYDPTLPWVFKVRYDGHLGCKIYIYVDDGKVTGWCKVACWEAVSCFSKVLSKLGIQDACRKRTEPSVMPGPWASSVVHTEESISGKRPGQWWRNYGPCWNRRLSIGRTWSKSVGS